jgi:uncharacterized membrane protein YoaK (UPF0700 family)
MPPTDRKPRGGISGQSRMLVYSSLLAMNAGQVNAVAILIMAVPVGNLTGVTTQIGMDRAHPWRYESHVLFAILVGFLIGAAVAGALLASKRVPVGSRHAAVLAIQAALLLLAAAGIEEPEIKTMISGSGIEETAVQALLAASALGLQNGLTSSFRGMPVRTTHFTGTVTDLGLMLGRARREGIDKWKFAILTSTLLFFLTGAIGGLMIGARIGGHALLVPATICLVLAAVSVSRSRRRRNQRELAAAEAST